MNTFTKCTAMKLNGILHYMTVCLRHPTHVSLVSSDIASTTDVLHAKSPVSSCLSMCHI